MATIINPITTVLLSPAEFESGDFDRFPFKYVLETSGTITYHTSFTCNRYLATKAATIPGLASTPSTENTSVNEFQALAYGELIPINLLHRIEKFFKDVMVLNGTTGNFEAQTFIVWNDNTNEYRVVIPEQTVSQTRVSYDIQDILGDGDHIIVDIHSHNTMGAFYSGTDDADDKKNSWISGVMGKLNTDTTAMVFRFNDGTGGNYPMSLGDIFDVEVMETPKEWLDKVKTAAPAVYSKPRGVCENGRFTPRVNNPYSGYTGGGFLDELDRFSGEVDTPYESDAIYDELTDALTDLNAKESSNVLSAVIKNLRNPNFYEELTDRENSAFIEIASLTVMYQSSDILRVAVELNKKV